MKGRVLTFRQWLRQESELQELFRKFWSRGDVDCIKSYLETAWNASYFNYYERELGRKKRKNK